MIVSLDRIYSAGHGCFEEVMALYRDAFPPEERRERDALVSMLEDPQLNFCAALEGDQLVGLVVFWKFDRFLFIEQLAVMPGKRRSGTGTRILKLIQDERVPVLLEVEISYDSASEGRIDFYLRNGFSPLPVNYAQPPYRKGEQVLPMKLWSDQTGWIPASLDDCIRQLHAKVYNHNS